VTSLEKEKNILWRKKKEKVFCEEKNISLEELQRIIRREKKYYSKKEMNE
jgi:hypothetical protein